MAFTTEWTIHSHTPDGTPIPEDTRGTGRIQHHHTPNTRPGIGAWDEHLAGRRLADHLVTRDAWNRLVRLMDQRGRFRARRALRQLLLFAAFHADEQGQLRELHRLEYLYADYYHGKIECGRRRFYEHLDMAERSGFIRQDQWPSQVGRAGYRLTMPVDLVPGDLPMDLATRFRLDRLDTEDGRDEALAPVGTAYTGGRNPAAVAGRAVPAPRVPAVIEDQAAAAEARRLTIEPWLDDVYLVAAAMATKRRSDLAVGREFDPEAAEARAWARLGRRAEDHDYEVVAEADLLAAAEHPETTAKEAPVQLVLRNPHTSPYSRDGSDPSLSVTLGEYWVQSRTGEKSKAQRPPSGATINVGPFERRRASVLVRAHIWHVWREWGIDQGRKVPITEGQWHDLTTGVALALRRTTEAHVIEECTRSLGSARSLALVVGSRLWALIRENSEWPEWAAYRRSLMQVEPGWTFSTSPSVIGPASARIELQRARGGVERIGTQLALTLEPLATGASQYAAEARRAMGVAALGAERYQPPPQYAYGAIVPDTARIGVWELETEVARRVAADRAAARPTAEQLQDEQRRRAQARAQRAADRPTVHAQASALARASRRARGTDR